MQAVVRQMCRTESLNPGPNPLANNRPNYPYHYIIIRRLPVTATVKCKLSDTICSRQSLPLRHFANFLSTKPVKNVHNIKQKSAHGHDSLNMNLVAEKWSVAGGRNILISGAE